MLRNRIMENFNSIRALTAPELRVTLLQLRCPSGATWVTASAATGGLRLRTLGYAALALQATGAPDPGAGGFDIVQLIADATWFSKSILLLLLLFSAISWGIILLKIWQYRRASRDTGTFLQVFR